MAATAEPLTNSSREANILVKVVSSVPSEKARSQYCSVRGCKSSSVHPRVTPCYRLPTRAVASISTRICGATSRAKTVVFAGRAA
jgi:hypothetical protein